MRINILHDLISPLSIDKYNIYYDDAFYYMSNFLFNNIKKNIVVINDGYHFDNNWDNAPLYISKVLKNPTYFEILVETNKSIAITGDYDQNVLFGLKKIKDINLKQWYGINKPFKKISYYNLVMCPNSLL